MCRYFRCNVFGCGLNSLCFSYSVHFLHSNIFASESYEKKNISVCCFHFMRVLFTSDMEQCCKNLANEAKEKHMSFCTLFFRYGND